VSLIGTTVSFGHKSITHQRRYTTWKNCNREIVFLCWKIKSILVFCIVNTMDKKLSH